MKKIHQAEKLIAKYKQRGKKNEELQNQIKSLQLEID